jgi:hypothetical protein
MLPPALALLCVFKHQPDHKIHRVHEATVEEQYWFLEIEFNVSYSLEELP